MCWDLGQSGNSHHPRFRSSLMNRKCRRGTCKVNSKIICEMEHNETYRKACTHLALYKYKYIYIYIYIYIIPISGYQGPHPHFVSVQSAISLSIRFAMGLERICFEFRLAWNHALSTRVFINSRCVPGLEKWRSTLPPKRQISPT